MQTRKRDNRVMLLLTLLGVIVALLFFGGSWGRMGPMGNMGGHRMGMMGELPEVYAGLRSPLPVTAETVYAGAALYQGHCAVCHGVQGLGDGPAAKGLNPPPSNLRRMMSMPRMKDDYLFWVVSEGGKRNGSAMPGFKSALTEKLHWQLVAYLRRF